MESDAEPKNGAQDLDHSSPVTAALGGAAEVVANLSPALFGAMHGLDPERLREVAEAIIAAVSQASGIDVKAEPRRARRTLAARGPSSMCLQVHLAKVAADLEKAKLLEVQCVISSSFGGFLSEIRDTKSKDSSAEAVRLSTKRSLIMAAGSGIGLVMCTAAGLYLAQNATLLNNQLGGMIITFLVAVATTFGNNLSSVYNFEFGSSKSSDAKTGQVTDMAKDAMSHLANANQTTVPISSLRASGPAATGAPGLQSGVSTQ